jgi:hypothetical protein
MLARTTKLRSTAVTPSMDLRGKKLEVVAILLLRKNSSG